MIDEWTDRTLAALITLRAERCSANMINWHTGARRKHLRNIKRGADLFLETMWRDSFCNEVILVAY